MKLWKLSPCYCLDRETKGNKVHNVAVDISCLLVHRHRRGGCLAIAALRQWLGFDTAPAAYKVGCEILYGVENLTACKFDTRACVDTWPGIQGENDNSSHESHPEVLVLAWAYILSAHWLELQQESSPLIEHPNAPKMRYSHNHADEAQHISTRRQNCLRCRRRSR